MMPKIVLTGDRPTGCLHLGHYIGSLQNRLVLQESCKQYVMIADVQAFTDHFEDPECIRKNRLEVIKDYISVGIDPEKTTIFIQSQVPEITELTVYYLNLVTLSRLARNPTVKLELKQKNYGDSIPAGFFCYPVSQAADITIFGADLVPVGADQLPMIEQTNEIVRRFNHIYNTHCLKPCQPYLSQSPRLIGIDGQAKASKSLKNAIFLSDSPEQIKKKVFQMFTDPGHVRVNDPGKVAGNVVFAYLDAFHPQKEAVASLKQRYEKGGLGDTVLKSLLNEVLQDFLKPIREKRAQLEEAKMREILHQGTLKARLAAQATLRKVRAAMGISDCD